MEIRRRRTLAVWQHSPCAWAGWVRSAARMAPAACWASWADALPMVHERLPGVAENAVIALEGDDELEGCLGELRIVAVGLDRQGFVGRLQWGDGSPSTSTRH